MCSRLELIPKLTLQKPYLASSATPRNGTTSRKSDDGGDRPSITSHHFILLLTLNLQSHWTRHTAHGYSVDYYCSTGLLLHGRLQLAASLLSVPCSLERQPMMIGNFSPRLAFATSQQCRRSCRFFGEAILNENPCSSLAALVLYVDTRFK
jgi:hypothetical protein